MTRDMQWHVQPLASEDNSAIYDAAGRNVAVCDPRRAALIAAAPDLLAVVDELIESAADWSEYDVPLGIVDRLRAAATKATRPVS